MKKIIIITAILGILLISPGCKKSSVIPAIQEFIFTFSVRGSMVDGILSTFSKKAAKNTTLTINFSDLNVTDSNIDTNYMVVRNRIYLTGVDLNKVKKVKYLLHPSFSNPIAVSEDATNSFEAWIWSWGGFPIKATITTNSGQVFEKQFDFSFKSKFEEAQSKGIPQTMRCEE